MGTVFDDDFDFIAFSANKQNTGWAPTGSMAALSGWRRECDQMCDPNSGDPECYDGQRDCECDRAGGRNSPDGERCVQGKWCIYDVSPSPVQKGEVCPVCCLDTTQVMWDSSNPEYKADSFNDFVFCPPLSAMNAQQGACGCADDDDVMCNNVCKNCSMEKVTKDAQGNQIPELDCNDILSECGIDPATCDCVSCAGPDHEERPSSDKWCCPKCVVGKFINPREHRISEDDYQSIINDKEKACLCCPEAINDDELDVSKLPNCEFKTQKYKCIRGVCVKDENGKYASRIECMNSGCEDYECYNDGGIKRCVRTNSDIEGEVANPKKGPYSRDAFRTAKENCEQGCTGWVCFDAAAPWNDCCETASILRAKGLNKTTYATEGMCKNSEQSCAAGRVPCVFPFANDPQAFCACRCINGNQIDPLNPDDPCGVAGPAGPFPPPGGGGGGGDGGGGGGGGDDGGGGEVDDGCGENASLEPESGLCYCDPGYVTMDGNAQCSNCAPGYARDANGGCCDPFNTPGGCDLVGATGFEPEEHFSSMCDGVDCPAGQSCFQSVFGAECR